MLDIIRYFLGILYGRRFVPKTLSVGKGTWIGPFAKIDLMANGSLIKIGKEVTICNDVRIICHDASSNRRIHATRFAPVFIGDRTYIGAGAIILPGVTIGDDVVIGAGSVVTKNMPSGSVAVGNPARIIGETKELDNRRIEEMKNKHVFSYVEYGGRRISIKHTKDIINCIQKNSSSNYIVGKEYLER